MFVDNPHFADDAPDVLFHFGMSTLTHDFAKLFGDVKFILCGGSASRMRQMTEFLSKFLQIDLINGPINLCQTDRYVIYKIGRVMCVNHGIGVPSMSIMLHEMFKLLRHAKCTDVSIIRIGTSGGIGIPGGTLVVSDGALNALLEPVHETEIIGKRVKFPAILDAGLCDDLYRCAKSHNYAVVKGKTVCTNDFYEGQGRLDGALCSFTKDDKMAFLEKAKSLGVCNFEMEAAAFAALTHRAGVKAAVVCVTLLNRLEADQILQSADVIHGFEHRPCHLLAAFIKQRLEKC